MSILTQVQKMAVKKKAPNIRPGCTVRVHQRIKEGEKERVQVFEGLVIKMNSGYGADKTITVRKIVGGIGVEKIFPIYSTNIIKIEIKKKSKVRQAKLYYMRERFGKSARLKESFVSEKEQEEAVEELAEEKAKEQSRREAEAQKTETKEEKQEQETESPKEQKKEKEEPPQEEKKE